MKINLYNFFLLFFLLIKSFSLTLALDYKYEFPQNPQDKIKKESNIFNEYNLEETQYTPILLRGFYTFVLLNNVLDATDLAIANSASEIKTVQNMMSISSATGISGIIDLQILLSPYIKKHPLYFGTDVLYAKEIFQVFPYYSLILPKKNAFYTGFFNIGYKFYVSWPNIRAMGPTISSGFKYSFLTTDYELTFSNSLELKQFIIKTGLWLDSWGMLEFYETFRKMLFGLN